MPPNGGHDFGRELGVPVEDQELGRNIGLPRLPQLQPSPEFARIPRDVAMEDGTSVVADDKEAVQDSKGQRGNREEVHRSDGVAMVLEECQPLLSGVGANLVFLHPSRDRPF